MSKPDRCHYIGCSNKVDAAQPFASPDLRVPLCPAHIGMVLLALREQVPTSTRLIVDLEVDGDGHTTLYVRQRR